MIILFNNSYGEIGLILLTIQEKNIYSKIDIINKIANKSIIKYFIFIFFFITPNDIIKIDSIPKKNIIINDFLNNIFLVILLFLSINAILLILFNSFILLRNSFIIYLVV